MELFKLFGRIVVSNSEANSAIDETSNKAEGANTKISGAFNKIGSVALKVGKVIAEKLSLWQKNKEVKGNVLQKLWKRNPR